MAAIDFPNSPTPGDTFTASNKTWVYLDGKWTLPSVDGLVTSISSASSGQFLKWNGSAWVNDTIDLGADTAGSFVASLVAGTGVTLANNSGEASTPTVTVDTAVIQARVTNVTDTEIGYLDGVTSAIQTQIDTKAPLASPTFTGTVTVPTPISNTDASTKSYVDSTASTTASNASTALTNHEADTTNIHGIADTSILVTTTGTQTLTNKTITSPSGLVKGDVGLGNADNTSDANKPVSTAQQTALDLKANLASPTFTGTPTLPTGTIAVTQTVADNSTKVATTAFVRGEVTALVNSATATLDTLGEIATALGNDANLSATLTTSIGLKAPLASPTFTGTVTIPTGASITAPTGLVKGDVGLGNVDNTSNATERAATATLTNKTLTSPVINTPTGIVKGDVGLGNVDNTADTAKPVSTAQQTALDLKANLASPTFTGTVTIPAGASIADFAPLASPNLTGTPLAPTAAGGTNTTQIATTAFVTTAVSGAAITALNDVGDVTITSAESGQVLQWNGSAWVNAVGFAGNKQAILGSQIFG